MQNTAARVLVQAPNLVQAPWTTSVEEVVNLGSKCLETIFLEDRIHVDKMLLWSCMQNPLPKGLRKNGNLFLDVDHPLAMVCPWATSQNYKQSHLERKGGGWPKPAIHWHSAKKTRGET